MLCDTKGDAARQPFCDNEEMSQHWKLVIPEMLTWPQHHPSPDFMLSKSEYSYGLNQRWLSIPLPCQCFTKACVFPVP